MTEPTRFPLSLNAISTLVVHDLVKNAHGCAVSLRLQRQTPPAVENVYMNHFRVLAHGPPARLPSHLPPPGNLQLTLSSLECIGKGRCGYVFATSLLNICDKTDQSSFNLDQPAIPYIPELVLKVAKGTQVDRIAKEASMYEEMESLQGVGILRCYGWFEVDMDPSYVTPINILNKPPDMHTYPNRLSILLLERAGGRLPLHSMIQNEGDIWNIFEDMAQLGIQHMDIRHSNLLFAPDCPSALPSSTCSYHDRTHRCRVVDFDSARKVNLTSEQLYYENSAILGRLFEMMSAGVIVEPWEK